MEPPIPVNENNEQQIVVRNPGTLNKISARILVRNEEEQKHLESQSGAPSTLPQSC